MYDNNVDIFTKDLSNHLATNLHNTRNPRINLPIVRTNVEKNFLIFQICSLMREIPNHLLEPQSKVTLKRNFKKLTFSSY